MHWQPMIRRFVAALGGMVWFVSASAGADAPGAADAWPQFRGPHSSAVSTDSGLPEKWSATENVLWKTKIPGRGWSSPIVWGDRVFVTSAVQDKGEPEPVKKGLYLGGNRP